MLSVGIITAPRETSYLSASLDTYFQEWDIRPTIFAEPNSTGSRFDKYTDWVHNESRLGVVENFFKAASTMFYSTDTPFVMICEDDISWKPGSAKIVRQAMMDNQVGQFKMKQVGFFSPYCAKFNAYETLTKNSPGWHEARRIGPVWCGNLALVFPRDSLALFVDKYSDYQKFADVIHSDLAVGKVMIENKLKLIAHMPTLVNHLGHISCNEGNNNNVARFSPARLPAEPNQWP